AGVIDENVEAAEALPHRRGDAIELVEPAQIAGRERALGIRPGLDLPCGLLEPRLVARADRDTDTFRAETESDGPPDSLASARHQRRRAGKRNIHEISFSVLDSAAGARLGKAGARRQSN